MTLNITAQVRLRIQDRWRFASEEFLGDGNDDLFKLTQGSPYSTVTAATAYLRQATSYSATGTTIDGDLGLVRFSGTISANSAIRVNYQWAVFSDDEVTNFIQQGGNVAGASLEAIRSLMFDGMKRARWAAPDGSTYDDTAVLRHLKEMYDAFWKEQREAPEGGIASWSEQQQYYQSEYPS
jgi:hypothetical protein